MIEEIERRRSEGLGWARRSGVQYTCGWLNFDSNSSCFIFIEDEVVRVEVLSYCGCFGRKVIFQFGFWDIFFFRIIVVDTLEQGWKVFIFFFDRFFYGFVCFICLFKGRKGFRVQERVQGFVIRINTRIILDGEGRFYFFLGSFCLRFEQSFRQRGRFGSQSRLG